MLGCTLIKHYGTDQRQTRLPKNVSKFVRRVAPRALYWSSNQALLRLARINRPDVVWLFKGTDIFPTTLRALRKQGCHTAVYNADHPFDFYSRGSGNNLIARSVPEYELFITFSRHIASQLAERHPNLSTSVIPFGHSVDDTTYAGLVSNTEVMRVCFLGNPDARRIKKICLLLAAGIDVDIYGHAWDKIGSQIERARLCGPVYGLNMYNTLHRYRVQLNFLRPHNAHSHNMRTFEAPACGAIMLADDTVEHREFFRPNVEAFYFSNDDELIAQAKYLLSLSTDDARIIRERARKRCVNEPYSYRDRSAQALNQLMELNDT